MGRVSNARVEAVLVRPPPFTQPERRDKDLSLHRPTSIATIPTQSAVLDGEVVALDEHGQPSFQALHHGSKQSLVYYAFDLLELNGQDLTRWPLERRRAELSTLVSGTRVLLSETLPGTPEQIEAASAAFGWKASSRNERIPSTKPGAAAPRRSRCGSAAGRNS